MRTGFGKWVHDVREAAEDGWKYGALFGAYYAYVGANLTVTSRWPVGTNVFDREWDALVVLDACRVDAMRAVADEFEFIEGVESVRSVGSTSGEWMAHTFDRGYEDRIADTAMVTANVHSDTVLRKRNTPPQYAASPVAWPRWDPVGPAALGLLEEVWADGWDDEVGTVPPRVTTDRAVRAGRESDHARLLVHYLQPHAPYLEEREPGSVSALHADPMESLQAGELTREEAWDAYLETLRLALSEVELLLGNLDAERVVLTADHGEAFGEFGFYEHPVACPHPAVKRVPWVETTATDAGEYDPPGRDIEDRADHGIDDRLEALGYL